MAAGWLPILPTMITQCVIGQQSHGARGVGGGLSPAFERVLGVLGWAVRDSNPGPSDQKFDLLKDGAVALYLDSKNTPIAWRTVSIGTDVMAPVKPLLVLQPAVLLGANALIFAHNHPSGDLEPSPDDLRLAETLCASSKLLGLRLLDNVIWTKTGSRSYGSVAR